MLLFGRAAREIDLSSDKSSPVFPGSLQLNPLKETNLGVAHAPAQYGCTVSFYRYFFSSRITASFLISRVHERVLSEIVREYFRAAVSAINSGRHDNVV